LLGGSIKKNENLSKDGGSLGCGLNPRPTDYYALMGTN
jgi:hypothetical protein